MAPLADYPDSFGAHRGSVFAHIGPASYTQMTKSPVAGGDTVEAVEAGLKFFDAVIPVGMSDSGDYWVMAVAPAANPSDSKTGAPATTWRLQWFLSASFTEVTGAVDLSAEVVRLFGVGRY